MKRKIKIMISAVIALLLCVLLVIGNLPKEKLTAVKASEGFSQSLADEDSLKTVQSEQVIIQNENLILQLDCATTHFTVTHKSSGQVYHSVAERSDGFEPSAEQTAEVVISYYDGNSSKATMNSNEHSVQKSAYEVKTDGRVIRVNYSIQKSEQQIFVPEVVGQELFEAQILAKLESGPKRRMKQFYHLYETEGNDAETKEQKDRYDALSRENLYILSDTVVEHNYSEITEYMETAGFAQDSYAKELERLGLENSIDNKQPAAFEVPVEYALTESGFVATVLTEQITSASDSYKLTNLSLLPNFGSCGMSQEGWMLVPDGSGAIIEVAQKAGSTYSQVIWGNDVAVDASVKANMMQNAGMPVYGFHTGEQAYFAVITGGTAAATVNAEVYGNEFQQNRIYTDFNILAFDTSDMGELSRKAEFNLYASKYLEEFPQITYALFPDQEATYSDMANWYRDYLIAAGVLTAKLEEESLPLYIDFTGYETIEESVLGIATEAEVVLSDLQGIHTALTELSNRGVGNLQVRLRAYANGGVYGSVGDGYDLEKCVGSQEELDELAKQLSEDGGILYLENNISTVYTSGQSFRKMTHAVRNLKKMVAEGIDFDLVARTKVEAVNSYYLTSPAYYVSLTENFIARLQKESDAASLYGYSWSDYGSKLWSDFNVEYPYDRSQTVDASQAAVGKAKEVFDKVITDGSNSYVLGDVTAVLNIPLTYSALHSESYSVPFYQMVLHGYVDYAGAPMNTSADAQKNYLASIESGAGLYYSCYTKGSNPLKETAAGTLVYPTEIGASYQKIEEQYAEFAKIFTELRTQVITEHRRVAENVFATTYEDGTMIVVNYSEKEVQVESVAVPALGFALVERGQS